MSCRAASDPKLTGTIRPKAPAAPTIGAQPCRGGPGATPVLCSPIASALVLPRIPRNPPKPRNAGLMAAKTDASGNVLDLGRRRRTVSPSLRRALLLRDRGCRFPGCRHRAFVDAHHIEHWAHGGPTALDNTVLLCHRHHVLLHEGGFGVRRDGGSLRFLDPDGRTLDPNPKPHPVPGALRALEVDHEARGISIDARTALPRRPEQVEIAGCVRALAALHPWE